ncbi:hypothetical protein YC2023_015689 [Brassica napus]
MCLIMRLGLEMKEGLLLWWLSRGMTENLSRWKEGSVIKHKTSASSLVIDPSRVTQLSWTPRFVKGKLEKSMVADNDSGESVASGVHTSSGMFLSKRQVRASVLEIELLARLHHRHLVALKGFCVKKNER